MTISRSQLLDRIKKAGVMASPAGDGGEIAVRCPRCSSVYANRRLTLYINSDSGSFICRRCSPKFAGLGGSNDRRVIALTRILRELGVDSTGLDIPIITDLAMIRARLRAGHALRPTELNNQLVELPKEYSIDFHSTITGRIVLKYLASRNVSEHTIVQRQVGYGSGDPTWGHAIFPVIINGVVKFWQARNAVLKNPAAKYLSCAGVKVTEVLYGYDFIDPSKEVTLVEGIFDSLAVPNSLALLGKHISNTQLMLLQAKKISHIRVMLDGDAREASQVVAKQVQSKLVGLKSLYIEMLPDYYDPATYVFSAVKPVNPSVVLKVLSYDI